MMSYERLLQEVFYYSTIHMVQNFRGAKLLWLGHHVSIRRKAFVFASKQCPQVLEICRKTCMVQAKSAKTTKFGPLNVLYYTVSTIYVHILRNVTSEAPQI